MDLVYILYVDIGSQFYSAIPLTMPMALRSQTDYILYDDRYRSKALFSNSPTYAYGLEVMVTDLEL